MSDWPEPSRIDTEIEYLVRIRSHYDLLSESERRIANYVLEHKDAILPMTAHALSEKVGTSAATIVRFCHSLDFKGYNDLKYYIQREILAGKSARLKITPDDSFNMIKQKVVSHNKSIIDETLTGLEAENLELAVDAIAKASQVDIYGEGGSGINALQLGYLLLQIGLSCLAYNDPYMQMLSASKLNAGDVAIAISHSGRSINTIDSLKAARSRGAITICITGCINSPLTEHSDIKLYTGASLTSAYSDMAVARISELSVISILHTCLLMKNETRFGSCLKHAQEAFEVKRVNGPPARLAFVSDEAAPGEASATET